MAQPVGPTLRDLLVGASNLYPAAVRSGAAYWSEMVVNMSTYYADVLEAMINAAREPRRSGELLSGSLERFRDYLQRSGDTVERVILDFNQAIMTVARPPADTSDGAAGMSDRIADTLRQFDEFTSGRATGSHADHLQPDLQTLRERLETCLREIERLDRGGRSVPPADAASAE